MKPHRLTPLIAGAVLALGLAACGGSGGGATSSAGASAGADTSAAAATTETAAADSAGGGLTPPGTKLKLGEEATVGWVPPSTYDAAGGRRGIELRIAVDSIEKGTLDDFANVELEPNQRHSTPYYVKVRVTTLDRTEPPEIDDPDISLQAIDDRGQQQQSVTFLGEFPTCENETPPRPFKDGESYESCLTYLLPGGGSIARMQWNDGPSKPEQVTAYFDDPVTWEGS